MGFIEFSINPMGFIGFSELLCMTSLWYNNVNIALVTRRYWKLYRVRILISTLEVLVSTNENEVLGSTTFCMNEVLVSTNENGNLDPLMRMRY